MTRAARAADVAMLVLSIVLGVGSVVMFARLHSIRWVDMGWPDSLALPWDALLSLAFFVQHSGMIRRPVRARLAAVLPPHYQGALYSIASRGRPQRQVPMLVPWRRRVVTRTAPA